MKIANALKPLMAWMVILLAFNHLVRYYLGGKLMNLLLHPSSNSSVFTFLGHSDSAGNDSTRPGYLVIHGRSAESLMTTVSSNPSSTCYIYIREIISLI